MFCFLSLRAPKLVCLQQPPTTFFKESVPKHDGQPWCMYKHLVHAIGLTVLIFISTPAYLQQIKLKAELAWRPCQQEFNLIGFSEYAMLDKCLNIAHEPIITQIDFFKVQ